MPWSIKENGGKYCVVSDKDGKTLKCYPDRESALKYQKALYASEPMMNKMEADQERLLLEKVGPALVAVGTTAKPHLRQRGQEIKLVEINGEKFVEVPLFKKGLYRHPRGELVFNDAFMQRMVENHKNKVTDYNVHLDFRHSDTQGALAFLDPDDGGWLEVKNDWLYAYGKPTDTQAEKIITSRKWRYASPEFAPDYESNFVQKLSSDDLNEINPEDLIIRMEDTMPKKLTLGSQVIQLEGEVQDTQISAIEDAYKEVADKVTQLEAKIVELSPKTEPELPAAYRIRLEQLEAENRQLAQERRIEKVNLVLERARNHRDGRGYGHDKVFIDLAEAALKLSAYEVDGATIKLEDSGKVGDVIAFYSNIVMKMLEKVPGTVPMAGKTVGDDMRLESAFGMGNNHFTTEELAKAQEDFWK